MFYYYVNVMLNGIKQRKNKNVCAHTKIVRAHIYLYRLFKEALILAQKQVTEKTYG